MKTIILAGLLAVAPFGAKADYLAYDEKTSDGQIVTTYLRFERATGGCPNQIPTDATPNYWSTGRLTQGSKNETLCWIAFQGNYEIYQASNRNTRKIAVGKFEQWSDPMPGPVAQTPVPPTVATPKPTKEQMADKCAREAMFYRMVAFQKTKHTDPKDVLAKDAGSIFTGIQIQEKKKIINFLYFTNETSNMNLAQIETTAFSICMDKERNFQPLQ